MGILLDTNALIWMEFDDPRLGRAAIQTIETERRANRAFICPISYWEVQLSIERKRMSLSIPIEQWRRDHLAACYVGR